METNKKYAECGKVTSAIKRKCTLEGESLEEMIRRCTESNEPIESTAPMIYTEEADGVQPQYDPRADRFDIALDAVDKYNKSREAETAPKDDRPMAQAEESQE